MEQKKTTIPRLSKETHKDHYDGISEALIASVCTAGSYSPRALYRCMEALKFKTLDALLEAGESGAEVTAVTATGTVVKNYVDTAAAPSASKVEQIASTSPCGKDILGA